MTMKNFILSAILASLAFSGCETLDYYECNIKSRAESEGWNASPPSMTFPPGAALFIAAVRAPKNYDWRRDSAAGLSGADIIIFRNFEELLKIHTGEDQFISTDPDSHHFIGGKLYTEFTTASQTVIKCNGEELFRYDGREFLKGLLIRDDGVWTLGKNKDGGGFSLRCNGVPTLRKNSGEIFGDLSFSPEGALYEDGGKICFAYSVAMGAIQSQVMVCDGEEFGYITDGTVYDLRRINGITYFLMEKASDKRAYIMHDNIFSRCLTNDEKIVECHLLHTEDGKIGFAGTILSRTTLNAIYNVMNTGRVSNPTSGDCFAYPAGKSPYLVIPQETALRVLSGQTGSLIGYPQGEWYFYTKQCFCGNDSGWFLALTPKKGDSPPKILDSEGREREVDVYGFISAIEWVSNPPN